MNILIVEDEKNLGITLKNFLDEHSFLCQLTTSFFEAENLLKNVVFDFLLLDLHLPDGNGFQLTPFIKCPYFIISGDNDANKRLQALENGAQDFIGKPFHLKEILLKLQKYYPFKISFKTFDFYPFNHLLSCDSIEYELTKKESQILLYLFQNKMKNVSREVLLELFWKNEYPSERTIDNIIVKLRKYFQENPWFKIKTIHGVGYRLEELSHNFL